jgi:CheY-like chemotaxis protein
MADILIVDDENTIREMLVVWFSDKGHHVSEASNGLIAQQMIFSRQFDLIITDIMMPDMNGMELLKSVKFTNPHIKFIVMTGFHKPENIPLCLKYNISRYIQKPFRMEQINSVVEEVINEKESEKIKLSATVAEGWLELELYSNEESLMLLHNCMEQYLCGYLSSEETKMISFSFYEMFRNAIEWGNSFEKNLIVHVSCMVLSDRVVFKIQDEGKGFNVIQALKPITDPFDRQTARENAGKRPGGYGIEITKKYMDEFFYNEKGNCLIMTKIISKNAPQKHVSS